MTIDWANFTPWASLAGGILVGLAAAVFILMNGRVLGISGILGGLLPPKTSDAGWRIAVLLGIFSAPLVYGWLAPDGFKQAPRIDAGYGLLVIAGLLVGLGTRYGSGCTSGHGVCGLARLSPRSLVATLTFMAAGFVVVYVVRHLI
jgi:uncharacterized membrane protein YedE/YeeE